MASSRKPRRAEALTEAVTAAVRRSLPTLQGKRVAVGLSGGVDSVVLLYALSRHLPVRAVHVHHGLSPNGDAWARFCRAYCRSLEVPLTVKRVRVASRGEGLEAAARLARYGALRSVPADAIALAHQLDDQAETVLLNLLRGAGRRGASGMPAERRFHGKLLVRPLLDVPRESIVAYAKRHGLHWVDDEMNAREELARGFIRRRVAPLLAQRYPRWREALARAARHFSRAELDAQEMVRAFLAEKGLRSPSEAKLAEMVKQLAGGRSGTLLEHDGTRLRLYRGRLLQAGAPPVAFTPLAWRGEPKLALPALGGELVFRRVRGRGIDARVLEDGALTVRLRGGGERLQPDARRPRRTLKNLFQEAGVPAWQRERLPLLFRGEALVWVPGIGVDVRFQAQERAPAVLPEWREA
ncbi:MAG TPA: tRNA lysidine(34) synthetase TilS [Burkholderiales bacterium]|nr:tRNA lysidine(34) synthetase TilS [Burkholderiales bacterium]